MEAHSRAWLVRCPNCGHERSIWEIGGIRYKAVGEQRNYLRCPACAKRGWHKVSKAADFPQTHAPAWPLIRMILMVGLGVLLGVLILTAIISGLILKLTGAI